MGEWLVDEQLDVGVWLNLRPLSVKVEASQGPPALQGLHWNLPQDCPTSMMVFILGRDVSSWVVNPTQTQARGRQPCLFTTSASVRTAFAATLLSPSGLQGGCKF